MAGRFDEKKLRRMFRRFYISPRRIRWEEGEAIADLDKDTLHHIRTVLRLGEGAQIVLFDDSGKEYLSQIILSRPSKMRVKILEVKEPKTESELEIILAQALVREQAFDRILTSAVELGVKKIQPLITRRVVVKINPKEIDKKLYRWERIIKEACGMSARVRVPRIEYPKDLEEFLAQDLASFKIILWEKAKGGELKQVEKNPEPILEKKSIVLLCGPEGGFEDEEAELAIEKGFLPWGLGPRVLKADTAPVCALSILQYLFGDLSLAVE